MKNLILFALLLISLPISAQKELPYVVFNATPGVILKSPIRDNNEFYPVRGTKLFETDTFLLKDDRYFVKIKDKRNGEIFAWNRGKGAITPKQIVDQQRYDKTNKFFSFLISLAKETGFDTEPVRISQGVLYKGHSEDKQDSLTLALASQIRHAILDSIYLESVTANKFYSQDSTFCYSVNNNDSINYAMVIFTVTGDSVFKHDDILVYELGKVRYDKIDYLRLIPNMTLNLDYFSFSTAEDEDERTCYVLLFNPDDFYTKNKNGKYECLIDWNTLSKELTFQGDVSRIILLSRTCKNNTSVIF